MEIPLGSWAAVVQGMWLALGEEREVPEGVEHSEL